MTTGIRAVGFQQLAVVRRADRFSIDEKGAGSLMCLFGRVGGQAQISQRALQEAIQGRRLRFADIGSEGAGKNRRRGGKVEVCIDRGLIPAGRAFKAAQCFTCGIVGLLLCRAFCRRWRNKRGTVKRWLSMKVALHQTVAELGNRPKNIQ